MRRYVFSASEGRSFKFGGVTEILFGGNLR